MENYLISVDLDGTIIPKLYDVSPYTIKVFNEVRKLGNKIIITTGRPFRSSFFVYYKMHLETPLINYNGQLITNPRDKNYEPTSTKMKREDILKVYNHERDNFTLFFVEEYDKIFTNMNDESFYELMHHNLLSTIYEGDLNETLKDDAHGSLFLAKEGKGQEIVDYVNANFKDIGARLWAWGSYKEIVELHSTKISKADALRKVQKELGFDREHTMVFGDSINDLELFNEGKITVTPSNGDDRIKKVASIVLDEDCEHDGIAKFLAKFFNLDI